MPTLRDGVCVCAASFFLFAGERACSQPCEHDWTSVGTDSSVNAMLVAETPQGVVLYASGFNNVAGLPVKGIAIWDGTQWSPLGEGLTDDDGFGSVRSLAIFDDGRGPALYAGGTFSVAGGMPVNNIARWDGKSWSDVGGGLTADPETPDVRMLEVLDDGTGPALYAGGWFEKAGGTEAFGLARWDGEAWTRLGDGIKSPVNVALEWDDGTGPALYFGGAVGGIDGLIRWDGLSFSVVGGGVDGPEGFVAALEVFDDGTGEKLYVGGLFDRAGGKYMENLVRWDGQFWEPVNEGLSSETTNDPVYKLLVFDDGSGPSLIAFGSFRRTNHTVTEHVARWRGDRWTGLGLGPSKGTAYAAARYDMDGRPTLWVGGKNNLSNLAYFQGSVKAHPADLSNDGKLDGDDYYRFTQGFYSFNYPDGDCDRSGTLDLFDFMCFFNNFNGPCP